MKNKTQILLPLILAAGILEPGVPAQTAPHEGPAADIITVTSSPGDEDRESEALYENARRHLRGEGVPKNTALAYELMQKSARSGHAEAIGALGWFHATGTVVAKDAALAAEWFRKGAEAGGAKARLNYGKVLLEGNGVPVDVATGRSWVERSAGQGLPEAMLELAFRHQDGSPGFDGGGRAAYGWFLKAAETGHADAMNAAGAACENGIGTPIDNHQAENWYRRAAMTGHVKAQANLGRLIGPLHTDAARRQEAIAWLTLAAEHDEITARKVLAESMNALAVEDLAEARSLASRFRAEILRRTGPNGGGR